MGSGEFQDFVAIAEEKVLHRTLLGSPEAAIPLGRIADLTVSACFGLLNRPSIAFGRIRNRLPEESAAATCAHWLAAVPGSA